MALSDGFFAAVNGMGLRLGIHPQDLLIVWYSESGLNPRAVNRIGARGLNQFLPSTLKGLGMSQADIDAYPTWPAEAQLPWIQKHLQNMIANYGPITSAALYYTGNFFPLALKRGKTPDTVIVRKEDGDAYRLNSTFDLDKKGWITIGDMARWLDGVAQQPGYRAAYERLRAAAPPGFELPPLPAPSPYDRVAWRPGQPDSSGGGGGLALALAAAVAAGLWWWSSQGRTR